MWLRHLFLFCSSRSGFVLFLFFIVWLVKIENWSFLKSHALNCRLENNFSIIDNRVFKNDCQRKIDHLIFCWNTICATNINTLKAIFAQIKSKQFFFFCWPSVCYWTNNNLVIWLPGINTVLNWNWSWGDTITQIYRFNNIHENLILQFKTSLRSSIWIMYLLHRAMDKKYNFFRVNDKIWRFDDSSRISQCTRIASSTLSFRLIFLFYAASFCSIENAGFKNNGTN